MKNWIHGAVLRRCIRAAWPALVGLMFSASAQAQRATIFGTVIDQTTAVVPGVKIILLNLDQGLKRETTTDDTGYFVVPWLQPGDYVVTAQKDGFALVEIKHVILHVGDVRSLRLDLPMGSVPIEIQVKGYSQAVETISPVLGQVVTRDVIRNAPLKGRNVLDLALLESGVTPTDGDDSSPGTYNIAGERSDSITYLLDGGLNNDLIDNRVVYNPNPDTIAEFRILTSNYPAEYGRSAGGIITTMIKSGTNQFHGTAFDFLRNDALNANSFFNKNDPDNLLPREVLKRNQFGGTLGGPLTTPKLLEDKGFFFFIGYQGTRQNRSSTLHNTTTFTPAELAGDFSRSGPGSGPDPNVAGFLQAHPFFQSNPALAARAIIDPTRINSVAQKYITANLIPTSATGQLSLQANATSGSDEVTTRSDFNFSRRHKLAFTLGIKRTHLLDPFPFANVSGFPDTSDFRAFFSNFIHTWIFSPNVLNEMSVTAQRCDIHGGFPAVHLPVPSDLGIGITPDKPSGPTALLFDYGTLAVGFSPEGPSHSADNTFAYSDSVTWNRGHHNWKFGAGLSPFQDNTDFAFNVDGRFDFIGSGGNGSQNAFADFLFGIPADFTQSASAHSNIRTKHTYLFAQDEWRVRKNLVLTIGIRYEYSTPKLDTMGRTFSIASGRRSQVFTNAPASMLFPGDSGAPRGVNFPDRNDWSPRFGFAWDPFSNGKTSLRGGFGVFYDILKAEDNLQFNGQPPFFSSAGFAFPPLPGNPFTEMNYISQPFAAAGVPNPFPSRVPPPRIDFAAAGFLPIGSSGSVFVVDPHLHTPYIYHYNLSLQREVGRDTVFETSYVGSSAHGLTALVDTNPMVLGTANRILNLAPGNSTCTSISGQCSFAWLPEFRNVTAAAYNSLGLSLKKQFSSTGVSGRSYFTLAYTYSHNIDNASGFRNRASQVPYYQPHLFRASADMDLRQRIVLSGGWEVPFESLRQFALKRLAQGWNLFPIVSWRTGFPLDVFANLPSALDHTSPGPSAAGDPGLVRANLVGPIQIFDPHTMHAFGGSAGIYWFNPTSFSNAQCDATDPSCSPGPTIFPSDSQAVANHGFRTYGTLPRNFFRGPSRFNIDLAVSKVTPLVKERLKAEIRADFFNLLNHAEFANPNTNINDRNFGKIQNTAAPRVIQLALRLTF